MLWEERPGRNSGPKLRLGRRAGSQHPGAPSGAGVQRALREKKVGWRERVALETKCLSSPGDKEVPSFDNSCHRHTHHTAGSAGEGRGAREQREGLRRDRSDFQ